jgi:hypothetical protein
MIKNKNPFFHEKLICLYLLEKRKIIEIGIKSKLGRAFENGKKKAKATQRNK